MTNIVKTPRAPTDADTDRFYRDVARLANGLSFGSLSAHSSARLAAPTTGLWAKGDFIKNSDPSELGAASSKYVITGWICVLGGTPGTWLESRNLTGN